MSGDDPGEAQLFYENYCAGCDQIDIPNSTPTSQFYYNDDTGVGVLVTSACDYELGYRTDRSELEDAGSGRTWFPSDSFRDYSVEQLNAELYDKVFPMIKDCPLRTTETTRRVLASNYPEEEWAARDPISSRKGPR